MKILKKFTLLLAAVALIGSSAFNPVTKVSAAEPVRHYVKYVSAINEWRYQATQTWSDTSNGRELYYLKQDIKDGDILVIEGSGSSLNLELNATLGNITYLRTTDAVVTAKGANELYVLKDTTAVFNGDVTTAYVYDNGICNLNNNVQNLYLNGVPSLAQTISVVGTVGTAYISAENIKEYKAYSFQSNSFRMENGSIKTDKSKYSMTAPAATPAPSTGTNSNDYDDVPKTGDSGLPIILLIIAALCFSARYALSYKQKKSQ